MNSEFIYFTAGVATATSIIALILSIRSYRWGREVLAARRSMLKSQSDAPARPIGIPPARSWLEKQVQGVYSDRTMEHLEEVDPKFSQWLKKK